MKNLIVSLTFILTLFSVSPLFAANTLVGVSTDGLVYEVNLTTGVLTQKGGEQTANFVLGAILRKKNTLYYLAVPSGSTEKAIYTVNLLTGATTKVDLDLASGDDDVRAMFFKGNKIALLTATSGGYRVYLANPTSGQTTLLSDQFIANVEPIAGAIARFGKKIFFVSKPDSDSTKRQILYSTKFSLDTKSIGVDDANGTQLCDRIKFNLPKLNLACLASNNEQSEVRVCTVSLNGKTKCSSPLANIQRIAGGHTMVSPNNKDFYALVYENGDPNSQRLIKFNAKGVVKSKVTISGALLVGIRFGIEEPAEES